MELILQTGLEHQQKAVDAVTDVFKDVRFEAPKQYFENPKLYLYDEHIWPNINDIQNRNNVGHNMRGKERADGSLDIDVKMETGTGKTYVYTHAIYELHQRYDINKFIIAVPSLPIKAGTEQFINDPYAQKHFCNTCGYGSMIDLCVLNAMTIKKGKHYFPSVVRDFVEGSCQNRNKIYVLLVNMNLLTGGKLLSRDDYDFGVQGFYRPFDALRATKPFVIIDEPHRFSREQSAYKTIIKELCPQCVIRFGATFPMITMGKGKDKSTYRDYRNLLYDLNACEAFNQNLIKGVAKEHFEPTGSKNEKIKITQIYNKMSVTLNHKTLNESKSYTLQKGESLGVISDELAGLTISGIGKGFVELSNGQEKKTGEEFTVDIYSESYQEQMVKLAIQRHFETERNNFGRNIKIKTLALFFIDNIESYRGDDKGNGAWLRDMFDRLLEERLEEELKATNTEEYENYLKASLANIPACRAAYFAQDNNDSDEEVGKEVDEILHNKKKLLSFANEDGTPNVRRFLFSKWTLKEGWDNPNVFTITKLRSSGSETSKIQEVGRGLRLPVDEYGNRISNYNFMLNYIVDFTEADFANKLVTQINGQLPVAVATTIPRGELIRVAESRGMDEMTFMFELYQKKYIKDSDRTINLDLFDDMYAEYPEFDLVGVSRSKIIDRNKKKKNTVKVRKARFEELKDLWAVINQKYVIFFNNDVNKLLEKDLPSILSDAVFDYQTMTAQRNSVATKDGQMTVVSDVGVTYIVKGKELPYNVFLKRLNKATSLPITMVHSAMCAFAKDNNHFEKSFINESSLSRIIAKLGEWKTKNLQGRIQYKQTKYDVKETALTKPDGTLKDDIVQGNIGIHIENGITSEKYLYDTIAYDSPMELKNIKSEISEVIVYGKIPRRSIAIPTIANSTYSPDFMYVVKKSNGEKELNIIVETKDVEGKQELRDEEKAKISCAEVFFNQLKVDGYSVHFRTQLNNKEMATIIMELMK